LSLRQGLVRIIGKGDKERLVPLGAPPSYCVQLFFFFLCSFFYLFYPLGNKKPPVLLQAVSYRQFFTTILLVANDNRVWYA
ncbi:hypothetical protein NUS47_11480, partial [Glaesserella parasuis]|nr:hypothetical protein [Glaesserella parasuis]